MAFTWGLDASGKPRTWGPAEQASFAAYLRKHGVSYGSWAAGHAGAAGTFQPPAQSAALAQATAAAQPGIDAILADQKKARADAQQQLANNQGFSQALATMYGGIAPQVQGLYSNAAGETGALAKGFGDAATASAAAQTSGAADILGRAGAPQGSVDAVNAQLGGPVGDVLYGTQGYIPAAGLAREGAAFGAAASSLPAYAGALGQQQAAQIRHDATVQNQSFLDALRAERDKIPGLAQDILNQQAQNDISRQSIASQNAYLQNTLRSTGATITGYDPLTGQPTYNAQQDTATRAATLAANQKAGKQARETAFTTARTTMFTDIKDLTTTVKGDPNAYPGSPEAKDHTVPPTYEKARTYLLGKYKDLLKYATRTTKPQLRARLNALIDDVLAANGIHPAAAKPAAKPATGFNPLAPPIGP
jgi:hypothetical protein